MTCAEERLLHSESRQTSGKFAGPFFKNGPWLASAGRAAQILPADERNAIPGATSRLAATTRRRKDGKLHEKRMKPLPADERNAIPGATSRLAATTRRRNDGKLHEKR